MHSFGLTERWLVLAEFPFVVNPLDAGAVGAPVHRELPLEARARHALHADRPLAAGEVAGELQTEACFAFHHVNAFERRRARWWSTCAPTPTPAIVEDLYLERLRAGKPIAPAELTRFRLGPCRPAR